MMKVMVHEVYDENLLVDTFPIKEKIYKHYEVIMTNPPIDTQNVGNRSTR